MRMATKDANCSPLQPLMDGMWTVGRSDATRRADAHPLLRGTNVKRKLTFILASCLLVASCWGQTLQAPEGRSGRATTPTASTVNKPAVAGEGSPLNFANNEIVSGSGTNWTLAHSPSPTASLMLFWSLPGFGGILLLPPTDYTLEGNAVTTTHSLRAGALHAFYRY
jgi:hypothetical protein